MARTPVSAFMLLAVATWTARSHSRDERRVFDSSGVLDPTSETLLFTDGRGIYLNEDANGRNLVRGGRISCADTKNFQRWCNPAEEITMNK
jgi:hypothetical protein